VTAGVFHPSQLAAALVVASVFLEVVVEEEEEELHAAQVDGSVALLEVVVVEEDQPAQSSRFQLPQVLLVASTGLLEVVELEDQTLQSALEEVLVLEEEVEVVLAAGVV